MSTADRCAVLAAVLGAIGLSEGHLGFLYLAMALLWWCIIELSTEIRAARRAASYTQALKGHP